MRAFCSGFIEGVFWAVVALSVAAALFICAPFIAVWIVWPRRRPAARSRRNEIAAIVANHRNQ